MEEAPNLEAQGFICEKRGRRHLLLRVIRTFFHSVGLVHFLNVILYGFYVIYSNIFNPIVELSFMVRTSWGFGTNWNVVSMSG